MTFFVPAIEPILWKRRSCLLGPTLSGTLMVAGVLMLVGAQPMQAQDSLPKGFTESIDVELVNVDVWVSNSDGLPVFGLSQDDFEVLHDGEPVALTHFAELRPQGEVPTSTSALAETASPSPESVVDDREYLIIYVDQLRLHPNDYGQVMRGLEALFASRPVPPEQFLILRQTQGLFVEVPFGSGPQQLKDALPKLRSLGVDGMQVDTETQQALASLRRSWREAQDLAGSRGNGLAIIPSGTAVQGSDGARGALSGTGNNFGPDACDIFLQRIGPSVDGWTRSQSQRVTTSLGHLSRAATFLAGLPGIKTVLYIGGGLDLSPGTALSNYVAGLCPTADAAFATNAIGEQMSSAFLQMTRHLNSNRVTVFPFQAGGVKASSSTSASADSTAGSNDSFRAQGSFEQAQRKSLRDGLDLVAGETGGRRLSQESELATLGRSLKARYSLAYSRPRQEDQEVPARGIENRIEVKLPDSSLELRYRRSVVSKNADQRLAEKLEGALFLGLIDNPLGARLGAGSLKPGDDDTWTVPLRVRLPISQLTFLSNDSVDVAEVRLQVMARNLDSGRITRKEQSFRVKRPEGADARSITLPLDVPTSAGPCSLAVGLRDEATGLSSVLSTALAVGPIPPAENP